MALTVFGEDDFDSLFKDKPLFTPVYFAAFMIVCVSIMLNLVISVLSNAYGEVKEEAFKPQRLRAIAAVDPTLLGDTLSDVFLHNAGVEEIRFWGRFVASKVTGDKTKALLAKLRNQRTFFQHMAFLTLQLDSGSPMHMSIAATDMLLALYFIDEMHSQFEREHCSSKIWAPQQHNATDVLVFGLPRPRLLDYARKRFVPGTFDEAAFWCIEVPSKSLRLTLESITEDALEHNNTWQQEASSYIEIVEDEEEDEDDDDDFENALAKKVNTLTRQVDAFLDRTSLEAAPTKSTSFATNTQR
jgi:hypothetical protein